APLLRAGVELTDAATGNQEVELRVVDVVADVDRLHEHRLAVERLRARVARIVMARPGELDLEAPSTDVLMGGSGDVAERDVVADGPGRETVAHERAAAVAGAADVVVAQHVVRLAAAVHRISARHVVRPATVGLAAIPVARGPALHSVLDWRDHRNGGRSAGARRAAARAATRAAGARAPVLTAALGCSAIAARAGAPAGHSAKSSTARRAAGSGASRAGSAARVLHAARR